MATYCIGDLHGRYDLFMMLLEKINFDSQTDKLYLLGDVIDWNYGGIKILDYVMQHKDACVLIRGNHEDFFLHMSKAYDVVMYDSDIKQVVSAAVDIYSDDLFAPIYEAFVGRLSKKSREAFYNSPTIKKWLKSGTPHIRGRLLDAMVEIAKATDFDKNKMSQIKWILGNLQSRYKTKPFVRELFEQSTEHYDMLKRYLMQSPNRISLKYQEKQFCLLHGKSAINPDASLRLEHPHANTNGVTYVFGHDPVPMLHRKIQENYNSFSFDFRRIFSWIDMNGNRYYNLDLSSNPIVALRLDDMSEYYVGIPSPKGNAKFWDVPDDVHPAVDAEYERVDVARLGNAVFDHAAVISKKDACQEFVIGIAGYSRCIHYARISWLDYRHGFVIRDWLDNQTIPEIIEKVRKDFAYQCNTPEGKRIENLLHESHLL